MLGKSVKLIVTLLYLILILYTGHYIYMYGTSLQSNNSVTWNRLYLTLNRLYLTFKDMFPVQHTYFSPMQK